MSIKHSIAQKKRFECQPHPRGMLGKKHSDETIKKMTESHNIRWSESSEIYKNSELYKNRWVGNNILKEKASNRMKSNNPMKRQDVKIKTVYTSRNNGVYKRCSERMIGEGNPNWKGGIEGEYCPIFTNKGWRSLIYKRDKNNCQYCGITKHLSYKVFERNLCIHHIDHNPKNCDLKNVILLCVRCNNLAEVKKYKDYIEQTLMEKLGVNYV